MIPENLSLKEQLYLITMNNNSGKIPVKYGNFQYTIAGAALFELAMMEKISLENKRIILKDSKKTKDPILDLVIELLEKSSKPKKIVTWLYKINFRNGKIKKLIRNSLYKKKYISKEEKKFLGIIPYTNYPLLKTREKIRLTTHLEKVLLHSNTIPETEALLFALMGATDILSTIIKDRAQRKKAKKRIKQLVKENELCTSYNEALREIQLAITASMVTVSTTSAIAAGH
ncbi:MAG: GPP34 family phosphoprotein [Bacteroidota bacterium]|nr:GPP34 family phosphoprotein [Bacteroidota bacterium]